MNENTTYFANGQRRVTVQRIPQRVFGLIFQPNRFFGFHFNHFTVLFEKRTDCDCGNCSRERQQWDADYTLFKEAQDIKKLFGAKVSVDRNWWRDDTDKAA